MQSVDTLCHKKTLSAHCRHSSLSADRRRSPCVSTMPAQPSEGLSTANCQQLPANCQQLPANCRQLPANCRQ